VAVTAIDLQVDDVPAAVSLLHRAYGWTVTADEDGFGEVMAGDLRIMLSKDAMVPWGATDGVILHEYVADVSAAVERATAAGAELLLGPLRTDWGTEAAYLRGPGNLVVDLCRDQPAGP
jgi:catechol 2,3-dioxygenase-like lactoylglutathione lyase family enzyme